MNALKFICRFIGFIVNLRLHNKIHQFDWLKNYCYKNKISDSWPYKFFLFENMTNLKMKSREEIRFLALLSKTQEKAAKLKNNQASKFNSEINCDDAEISNIDLTEDEDWRLPKVFN